MLGPVPRDELCFTLNNACSCTSMSKFSIHLGLPANELLRQLSLTAVVALSDRIRKDVHRMLGPEAYPEVWGG